ncbi:hypothetical protein KEM56_001930 [Ascosphaera pollenicola]|nr:hypothetical protein KEM56_001930 [Ascosphaera pollenicola]
MSSKENTYTTSDGASYNSAEYTTTGSGTNSQRKRLPYSNNDGSYYYNNANGSTYYNSGDGYARYNAPEGK